MNTCTCVCNLCMDEWAELSLPWRLYSCFLVKFVSVNLLTLLTLLQQERFVHCEQRCFLCSRGFWKKSCIRTHWDQRVFRWKNCSDKWKKYHLNAKQITLHLKFGQQDFYEHHCLGVQLTLSHFHAGLQKKYSQLYFRSQSWDGLSADIKWLWKTNKVIWNWLEAFMMSNLRRYLVGSIGRNLHGYMQLAICMTL